MLSVTALVVTVVVVETTWLLAGVHAVILDIWYHHVLQQVACTSLQHTVLTSSTYSVVAAMLHMHHVVVLGMGVAMLGVMVYAHCYMSYEVLNVWYTG